MVLPHGILACCHRQLSLVSAHVSTAARHTRARLKAQLYGLAANHPDQKEDDRDDQQDVEPAAERVGGHHSEEPQNDQQDDQKENHIHLRAALLRKQCQEKTESDRDVDPYEPCWFMIPTGAGASKWAS